MKAVLRKDRKERSSNIELLRIISMVLIVCHHYAVHGMYGLRDGGDLSFNRLWVQLLAFGGKLAVILFVLITGYFMVRSEFKAKKAVKLWMQISFYALLVSGIAILGAVVKIQNVPKIVLPVVFNTYWFATVYFLLYIFSGFINKFILALKRTDFLKLIILLVVVFSVVPTFLVARSYLSELITFMMLYVIAAYIRLYEPKVFESKKCLWVGIGIYALAFLSVPILDVLSLNFSFLTDKVRALADLNSIFMVLSGTFIFAGFRNMNIKPSRVINTIASATFGVYLIHDNFLLREVLWRDIFHNGDFADSPMLFLHSVLTILVVFVVCVIIDLLYQYTIEKWIMGWMDRHWEGITRPFMKMKKRIAKCLDKV